MFKSWLPESKDMLPLMWWKQNPVYLSAILALAGVICMVVTAILGSGLMSHLVFSFEAAFLQWRLWTPLTYVLVNPPSLWTLVGCFLLWRFGESVERHFGRRIFVKLLLLLLVISPLTISLLHLAGFRNFSCFGIAQLEFGVFIAFATVYPRAQISILILTLEAWVLAAIFVSINALQCVFGRDWGSLILLAANVGAAYAFIRYQKGELRVPSVPKIRLLPDPPKSSKPASSKPETKKSPSTPKGKGKAPTVDEILDKISSQGIQSLTAEERRILGKASEEK
jgi:membrane associated rhomboid family serine protease